MLALIAGGLAALVALTAAFACPAGRYRPGRWPVAYASLLPTSLLGLLCCVQATHPAAFGVALASALGLAWCVWTIRAHPMHTGEQPEPDKGDHGDDEDERDGRGGGNDRLGDPDRGPAGGGGVLPESPGVDWAAFEHDAYAAFAEHEQRTLTTAP